MARPPPPSTSLKATSHAPNQTIYITNLPSSKIQKEDLRRALYMLCSTYGPVLDVVALRTMKMRGQAHVVFRDVQTATQAMRALQGEEFLGREMKVSYAKSKSDVLARLDGTLPLPAAAAVGAVAATELQQSIFGAPPVISGAPGTEKVGAGLLRVPEKNSGDTTMEDATSSRASSVAGKKRPREDDGENAGTVAKRAVDSGSDSDSDVAMEEDSDDE